MVYPPLMPIRFNGRTNAAPSRARPPVVEPVLSRVDLIAKTIQDLPVHEADQYCNLFEPGVSLREGTEVQGNCRIGAYTEINGATLYPRTTIGRYCSVARNAAIGAPDHPLHCLGTSLALAGTRAALPDKYTRLGNDVWVGANAVILAGVSIGDGAVIGAGAVVTKDVEPYAVMIGLPARQARLRFARSTCERLLLLRWWELDHETIAALPHDDVEGCIRILQTLPARAHAAE